VEVRYPDLTTRTYRYNEPANMLGGSTLPSALTSIVDENAATFASYKYDASGRAVETQRGGGVERYQLAYNADGTTSVTDPLGTARTHQFQTVDGITRFAGTSQPGGAGFSAGVQSRTLDASGNVASQTDFNGVKTCYAYEPRATSRPSAWKVCPRRRAALRSQRRAQRCPPAAARSSPNGMRAGARRCGRPSRDAARPSPITARAARAALLLPR
jgi:uncharacterized protein RhaS with RHS repeats